MEEVMPQDARARLQGMFAKVPPSDHGRAWDDLWKKGDFLPWDRGEPSPALVDALAHKSDIIGPAVITSSNGQITRRKALVPGCGGGYDVLLFASLGYDAVGLEISENALTAARKFASENFDEFTVRKPEHGVGSYKFVHGNFLDKEDAWREGLGLESDERFDVIYDYTFLCALAPEMRPKWAERMSEMLAPEGRLICLEFPLFKPPSTGGPPFGLKSYSYVAHLTDPGKSVPYTSEGEPEPSYCSEQAVSSTSNELALERVAHWQPEKTHPVGQGTDFMSIWKHK